MNIPKLLILIIFTFVFTFCSDENLNDLPVLESDNPNPLYLLTNRNNSYYFGANPSDTCDFASGWVVDQKQIISDFRPIHNGIVLDPDSVIRTIYHPQMIERRYANGLHENLIMPDSLNLFFWEYESDQSIDPLSFQVKIAEQEWTEISSAAHSTPQIFHLHQTDTLHSYLAGFILDKPREDKIIVTGAVADDSAGLGNLINFARLNYQKINEARRNRLENYLSRTDLRTSLPEITEAVAWSQVSLDALATRFGEKGIWAGLPNAPVYKSRDIFIALPALLYSGDFQLARDVLTSAASQQLLSENHPQFGRIPDLLNRQPAQFHQADATWWYIRAIYIYLLHSGDRSLGAELFPVIKNALNGALRFQVDPKFFLLHDDYDTWMEDVARGNRAVEVQALWYTALQIGAKLALLNGSNDLYEHWLAIAETLKINFTEYFWNEYTFLMTDHLNTDGWSDREIRPNPVFCATVPDLQGIDPLIPGEIRAHVTSTVFHRLTRYYGVSGIWHDTDPDTQQIQNQAKKSRDNILNPDPVHAWLTGPVVSALNASGYIEPALTLFRNQAQHILYGQLPGTLARFISPEDEHTVGCESIVHTLGLAAFIINMFHDFVGFRPNALADVMIFQPLLSEPFDHFSARLPLMDYDLDFEAQLTETGTFFKFTGHNLPHPVKFSLRYAGYNELTFVLDSDNYRQEIFLMHEDRRSYKAFPELDWHFAPPQ